MLTGKQSAPLYFLPLSWWEGRVWVYVRVTSGSLARSQGQPCGCAGVDVQNTDEMGQNKTNLLTRIEDTACSFQSFNFWFSYIEHHLTWINHRLYEISNLQCQECMKSNFLFPFSLKQITFQIKITLQKSISKKNPSLFIFTWKYMQNSIIEWNGALISFPKVWKQCLDIRQQFLDFLSPLYLSSRLQHEEIQKYLPNYWIWTRCKHSLQQYTYQNCRQNTTYIFMLHPSTVP